MEVIKAKELVEQEPNRFNVVSDIVGDSSKGF